MSSQSASSRKRNRKFDFLPKLLNPVRPNVGIEMLYRKRLLSLINDMHVSIQHWLLAAYRANEPLIAQDATPADQLRIEVQKLSRRWIKNFGDASKKMAEHFAKSTSRRSDASLRATLRGKGMTVKFQMTPAVRDIIDATINQNVSLIKSIPEQYLKSVEGAVMRSVQTGRDLGELSKDLQKSYVVTKRRAALIARDQNNKATSAMNRARQLEIGITEAVWVHSYAGREPRPTHLKNNGKRYDVTKGWFDPAVNKYIFPGELINCRCTSRSIIPGIQ